MTVAKHPNEATRIITTHTSYSGQAESPATPTESPEGSFGEDGVDGVMVGVEGEGRARRGLSVGLGAAFLLAEMAGAGLLSLPRAVANTGWVGLPMMVLLAIAVGFSGTLLAECWVILEETWPQYWAPCRRPYPEIGRRAFGLPGLIVAEVSLDLTLFGAATVFLIVASQMINTLLQPVLPSVSQCAWSLILGVLLCPTTWFSTPKDFWGAPILALLTTLLACLVVVVEVVVERNDHDKPLFPPTTFRPFFLGFGAILFALGGASLFPTIQNDMKDRSEFKQSVIITFLVLLSVYLPLSSICYGFLGDNGVPDNILLAVSGPAVTVAQVFIFCHFLLAFSVVTNPINQAIEGVFNTPQELGVKRVLLRTCVVLLVIFVAFTIPDFGKIMDLIGGSTVTLMSFVLPPLCYLRLNAITGLGGQPRRVLAKWKVVVMWAIVVLGLIGGTASTYSAAYTIITQQSFASTCFAPQSFFA